MSETYYDKFSSYYDAIHQNKDYIGESDFIVKHSKNFKNLLDVGCGTLSHSIILSKKFNQILGVDSSSQMLKIAKGKLEVEKIDNIVLTNGDLQKVDGSFDTIISMFNVVNHIDNLKDLLIFFESISKKLNNDGTFIFDCWNGVACCIDKPHEKSNFSVRNTLYTLICDNETKTNLFESVSVMKTNVKIYDDISEIDNFSYTINHKLWTPNLLLDILKNFGFESVEIFPKFDDTRHGNENDHRITFVCKKK